MSSLSSDLKDMGYEPSGEASPFHENGHLWTNGIEKVCDKTAIVVDESTDIIDRPGNNDHREERHEYQNSERIKLLGGYIAAYSSDNGISY